MSVNCICIDDTNRPEEIPEERWPKLKEKYTITHVFYHPLQGIQGVLLKEIKLTKENYPYESYKLSRFSVIDSDMDEFIDMIKLCNALDNVPDEVLKEVLTMPEKELVTIDK